MKYELVCGDVVISSATSPLRRGTFVLAKVPKTIAPGVTPRKVVPTLVAIPCASQSKWALRNSRGAPHFFALKQSSL
jgi:hypothetical protein